MAFIVPTLNTYYKKNIYCFPCVIPSASSDWIAFSVSS
jgi:hypothetical protein